MSGPQRRQVRVRRSPKVGVFLLLGAALGVIAALVAGLIVSGTSQGEAPVVGSAAGTSLGQAAGFLAVLLAPVGAAIGGLVALVLDRMSERRARTVEAERTKPAAPPKARPEEAADLAEARTDDGGPDPTS